MSDKFTYEAVEYSNGYYFTVFNPAGKAVRELYSEKEAEEATKALNTTRESEQ